MTYRELLKDIYKRYQYHILFFISAALIWSIFLFPFQFSTVNADTVINTPSSLSLESFGSSSAELATAFMETIGVSADPYAVLTFIGTASRLNDYFDWNLNISPGIMKYDVIFIMVLILFSINKISKCFGTTKALSMIHFGEIEKWVGFLFTALLSSSVFIDYVTDGSFVAQAAGPGCAAVTASTFTNALLIVLSFIITLFSWTVYYLVKMFFDFLDIITLPLSMIPGATFLYEAVKTLGILAVMLTIMFFPIIGLVLCILIVVTAVFFFQKSYAAMLYFRKIYIKPFFRGIFGYSKDIPLVHQKYPGKLKKLFPDASISLALPVYNIKTLRSPLLKKYTKLWLICADGQMYLWHPALKTKNSFLTLFSNIPGHPVYIKKSHRFFEIFCTLPSEDMNQKFAKISKEYHLVLSKEYTHRLTEIYCITGFAEYIPFKKPSKKKRNKQEKES